jgi:nitroreductase
MSAPFDLIETDRLLTTTRSVRKRLDLTRPVEREVVLDCLRIAQQAPNGSNRQPWWWVVVDDPDLRAGLGAMYLEAYAPYQTGAPDWSPETIGTSIRTSSDHLAAHLAEVPMLVIPCVAGRLPTHPTVRDGSRLYGSIIPAVWSFMLALRSRGLGSTYTTLLLSRAEEVGELLDIPTSFTQTALLPVAYTLGDDFKQGFRDPVEGVVSFNGWAGGQHAEAQS